MRIILIISALCSVLEIMLLSGCSPVEAWQKGSLAKREMAFDPDSSEARFRQHVFHSKEGAQGGYGVAAGGCGCN